MDTRACGCTDGCRDGTGDYVPSRPLRKAIQSLIFVEAQLSGLARPSKLGLSVHDPQTLTTRPAYEWP
eukprot:512088-Pleurochrysis_carterae.AAC.3